MQTFLPYPDFAASARVLDRQRLGKQRVECLQILNVLAKGSGGWANHPAVRMWRGYEQALQNYQGACILEWVRRGYTNTMETGYNPLASMPPWLGDPTLHASHRAALLHKLPEHYAQFGWTEAPGLDYIWPVPVLTEGHAEGQTKV